MATECQTFRLESGEFRKTGVSDAWERLKHDHAVLKQVLQEMKTDAMRIETESDSKQAFGKLLRLRLWMAAFSEELDRHSRWEEEELIPSLQVYYRRQPASSILDSFKLLESEHDAANVYIQCFLRMVHSLKPESGIAEMRKAAAYLSQACGMLIEHLGKEERLIFPLTEQILTDMDRLFS